VRPSFRVAAFSTVALLTTCALATAGEVRVPRELAWEVSPPPVAKTCAIEFNGRQTVGTPCSGLIYSEDWDGPVLVAWNVTARPIWVSYVHEANDGHVYQSACYQLPAHSHRAIPDQNILAYQRRQVHVSLSPGPGYPTSGFRSTCGERRQVLKAHWPWADTRN
jgi:hypothetical protein